jgi:hypothetical protein
MTRASHWFSALLVGCFAGRAEADAITYGFIQTGTNHPGFVANATLRFVDGTFHLPTITCSSSPSDRVNCSDPLEFGNLADLTVRFESYLHDDPSQPAHIDFTLADLQVPRPFPPGPPDFSQWYMRGTLNAFAVDFTDITGGHGFLLTPTNVFFNTDYLAFCLFGGHCVATGYWAPQVQPIPEPATATLMFTGIALVARRFVRRS